MIVDPADIPSVVATEAKDNFLLWSTCAGLDNAKGKDAKKQLSAAVSLIDKMAGKGVIHRNTASRYKSRLSARYAKSA